MSTKDTGLVGLAIIGILISVAGLWLVFTGFGSESFLLIIGGLIALATGITMTVIGFNSD
ncbi:hypothetical protein GCM10027417_30660 [Glutamicibacter endophyticus]